MPLEDKQQKNKKMMLRQRLITYCCIIYLSDQSSYTCLETLIFLERVHITRNARISKRIFRRTRSHYACGKTLNSQMYCMYLKNFQRSYAKNSPKDGRWALMWTRSSKARQCQSIAVLFLRVSAVCPGTVLWPLKAPDIFSIRSRRHSQAKQWRITVMQQNRRQTGRRISLLKQLQQKHIEVSEAFSH